ncbi:septation protein SpoVG [Candidatus Atribacteria bacterium 1244-E10-H5-B2]|nr:MAG: septation protein SpoVG [Candidatus Atribacteria bacterium 1244-E10-H5-B2]
MEITDVRLRKIETEGKLRAYVSVTFDDSFVVHDLRVIDGTKGMFVAMPSKRLPNGDHKDIAHPINTEIREKIQNAVLDVYNRELEEAPQVKVEAKVEAEEEEKGEESKVKESKEEEKVKESKVKESKEEEKVKESKEEEKEETAEEETEKKEEGLF